MFSKSPGFFSKTLKKIWQFSESFLSFGALSTQMITMFALVRSKQMFEIVVGTPLQSGSATKK